jgi:Ca-activated chloride channel family protein
MAAEDFNNDKKDAGEMGAGHCVTAFYELILVNSDDSSQGVDDLVFQDNSKPVSAAKAPADDWLYVKFRYKRPNSETSELMTKMAGIRNYTAIPDNDFVFASAVTEFALVLKHSDYQGGANLRDVIDRAKASRGTDEDGYRAQFIQLAELAYTFFR